jgi:hypothetical protein
MVGTCFGADESPLDGAEEQAMVDCRPRSTGVFDFLSAEKFSSLGALLFHDQQMGAELKAASKSERVTVFSSCWCFILLSPKASGIPTALARATDQLSFVDCLFGLLSFADYRRFSNKKSCRLPGLCLQCSA